MLDFAADGSVPQAKVRERLRSGGRDRKRIIGQLATVRNDLSGGMAYIEAHLTLLDAPYELYRFAFDETRRRLNQAIFAHIYVVHDEVAVDELNSPLAELPAAERRWSASQAALDDAASLEAAELELTRHGHEKKQSAPQWDARVAAAQSGADCSKSSVVHPPGLEPGTH
jgi:hypothetical protein